MILNPNLPKEVKDFYEQNLKDCKAIDAWCPDCTHRNGLGLCGVRDFKGTFPNQIWYGEEPFKQR